MIWHTSLVEIKFENFKFCYAFQEFKYCISFAEFDKMNHVLLLYRLIFCVVIHFICILILISLHGLYRANENLTLLSALND